MSFNNMQRTAQGFSEWMTVVGSVILMTEPGSLDADDTAALTGALREQDSEALIAADQEGGEVQQLTGSGFTSMPSGLEQAQDADLRAVAVGDHDLVLVGERGERAHGALEVLGRHGAFRLRRRLRRDRAQDGDPRVRHVRAEPGRRERLSDRPVLDYRHSL